MKILVTNTFKRSAKRLHAKQAKLLKDAINEISNDPKIGELKLGDLAGVRVYKFHILLQLILLVYIYDDLKREITLLFFAPHENFYRDLKKNFPN